MPARCGSCGEEALTETARFCIGCGAALPEVDPRDVLAAHAPPPPEPPPPVPSRPPAPQVAPPPRLPSPPPRDLSPLVPLPVIVAGVIGVVALLLILFLAA